jgi:catechol 2,3-dioxygenase-like lactoylglutathione lyase family enzyme
MGIAVRGVCPLLEVFDLPTSIQFYRNVLGFEVVEAAPAGDDCGWALLRLGEAELMLNTAYEADERPAAPDPGRVAAHADTTLFFGCPDVDAAYALLRERGVEVDEPRVREYGMKQLSLSDPDGYGLCFQWPAGMPEAGPEADPEEDPQAG